MKQKWIATMLAVCMLLTSLVLPAAAVEVTDCPGGDDCQHAAAVLENGVVLAHYDTLDEAIAAADGKTVQLLHDTSATVVIASGTETTLDLNGKTLTLATADPLVVEGTLTITDSTADEAPVISDDYATVTYTSGKILQSSSKSAVSVQNGGQLTVEAGTIECVNGNGINVVGNQDPETWAEAIASEATVAGGYILAREYGFGVYGNGAVANVTGGVIVAQDNAALAGNGSKTSELNCGGTTVNISGGTLIGHIITQGYIAVGLYLPQAGVTNITGGTIYADNGVGICIRNGGLNISDDATIIATGNESGKVGDAANQIPGKALVIDYSKSYNHNNDETDTRTVSISGGKLIAEQDAVEVYATEGNKIVSDFITGGTFSSDVSAYAADGIVVTENEDGTYGAAPLGAENAAAQIGDTYYATLGEAAAALTDGQTLQVLRSVALTSPITLNGTDITLDLGGNTVSNSAGTVVIAGEGASLTVQNGTLYSDNLRWTATLAASVDSHLTVAKDATVVGTYALGTADTSAAGGTGIVLDIYGTVKGVDDPAVLANGGAGGISIGGNIQNLTDCPTIHIYSGAVVSGSHGTSGNTNYDDGPAIYAAGYANWIIDEGATLSGDEVLSIKSGHFTINGGTFTATGSYYDPATAWGNGTEATGAAISITNNNAYAKNVTLTISGGTFVSENGYVIYESDTQSQSGSALSAEGLSITGGNFDGAQGDIYSKNATAFVSGGNYSNAVDSAYLADGFVLMPGSDGHAFTVVAKTVENVETATAAPSVPTAEELPDTIAEEDRADAIDAASSVDTTALGAYANSVAENLTEAQMEKANAAASELEGDATIYVRTYLDVQPKTYDSAAGTLTFSITPKYELLASTAENAADITADNSVIAETGTLTITSTVNLTITLPENFTVQDPDALYIQHDAKDGTYYYAATLNGQEISFTNPHGFSDFTLLEDSRTATVTFGDETLVLTPANLGDTLPIAEAPAGKRFSGWSFEGVSGTYTTLTSELLTALDGQTLTAEAVFRNKSSNSGTPDQSWTITVSDTTGGKVTSSASKASENAAVTLTVTANEGYILESLTVTDASGDKLQLENLGDGKYRFTMPDSAVTVKAVFTDETLPFTDVTADDWFYDAVVYAYENNVMNGVSDTRFAPNSQLSRAMMAQIFYNLAGQPEVTVTDCPFTDVTPDDWFYDAVNWAAQQELVTGFGDGTFLPNANVTREQMAVMLYRYAGSPSVPNLALTFDDADQVSDWADYAIRWAVDAELLNGKTGNLLDPAGSATRAEVAKVLMVYLSK